ncbi:MAG: 30S ribosomal protein S2 [Lentisphaerae bacterium]|jgi:small subunit ribosomal protein S2|nr:30S ribosomal protein S2 [Lentisphaerota bacterium]
MQTSITDLLEAGVHFGHKTRRWNPKMKPYIYGTRNGITIFDLTITMRQLAAACDYLSEIAANGGQILFVGVKRQAQECVRSVAESLDMPYMCDRWLGGTLTNQQVVLSRVSYMKKLQAKDADGSLDNLPKKEVAGLRRELEKLQTTLGGIANLKRLPAAMVVIDVAREHIAVQEAAKLGIPVVALVDSNCNPDLVEYVIPGNDDALRSIKVIMDTLAAAIADGLSLHTKKREDKAEKEAKAAAPEKDSDDDDDDDNAKA